MFRDMAPSGNSENATAYCTYYICWYCTINSCMHKINGNHSTRVVHGSVFLDPTPMFYGMVYVFKIQVANREQYEIVHFEENRNISLRVLLCFLRLRKTISYKIQTDQRHQRGKPERQTRPNVYEFTIASTFYQKEVVILIRDYMGRTDEFLSD